MKTSILLFLLTSFYGQSMLCQGYMKGDVLASASIGLTHLNKSFVKRQVTTEQFKSDFKGDVEVVSVKGQNPIALRYEYAFSNHFGLGFSVAWWSILLNVNDHYKTGSATNPTSQTDSYKYKMTSLAFGVRPNYHFKLSKGDLFIGCALGLAKNGMSVSYSTTAVSSPFAGSYYDFKPLNALYLSPTLGYRVYVTNNLSLNFEAGMEKGALLLTGLCFRFRPFKYEVKK